VGAERRGAWGAPFEAPHRVSCGEIVGGYLDAGGTLRSFLFDGERFITLDIPGALGSGANKINDRGQSSARTARSPTGTTPSRPAATSGIGAW